MAVCYEATPVPTFFQKGSKDILENRLERLAQYISLLTRDIAVG